MENFLLDKQTLTIKAVYNDTEISNSGNLLHTIKGISIIPIHFKIEPLVIKENLIQKSDNKNKVQKELYQNRYYTNIIDYTLGEISFAANFLTDSWSKLIWKLMIEEKENFLTISLTDDAIIEQITKENTQLFNEKNTVKEFCKIHNVDIQSLVQYAKFEQIELELEGVTARLSSEIIFFRKKLFTELFIQKIDAKIYEFEEIQMNIMPFAKKEIYSKWRNSQLRDIELVQKYIKSPFTFDDLDQFSNYQTINRFAVKNHQQQDLISETFYWMENFPKAKSRFVIAVEYYNSNGDLRDSVDNLRLSLEMLLKELLQNEKSLENQISNISNYQESLGIGKEIRNTFQKTLEYYNKFQNENVKHNDGINNVHEVEFIFGLTMIFIRMLIKPNNKFNLK
ncbi:hypothetical protein [Flavobacterium granuli]|uniref:Uncharacterized protein n=1 Tax=Flavobacterium granuli TaxID=280093 RepID=A0ABU1S3H7_9FLAO|nr:hypothetical protein [Flavobacterium granuli]MDR6845589.1 hypothetical protein [Flavobacterium granuli]